MKKNLPTPIKDGLTGIAIGTAVIVPGISGGTIALIFGVFEKIVNAVDNLFTKNFWKFLLVLIPFGIGAILAIAALIYPFQLAFEHCMFAIICLFAGLIIGSVPGTIDEVKDKKPNKINVLLLIIGFIIAALIGVLSVIFNFGDSITSLFNDVPFYLYFIIFGVGLISSTGLIVPGFSGSMLLLVIGFYKPIIGLVKLENLGRNISLLAAFGFGVVVGFIIFSKIMNYFITKHRRSTMYLVIGFVVGSIVSIFVNSNIFDYLKSDSFGTLDMVLSPILLVIGIILAFSFVRYTRKHRGENNA